LKPEVG
jgi:hypothetical protein